MRFDKILFAIILEIFLISFLVSELYENQVLSQPLLFSSYFVVQLILLVISIFLITPHLKETNSRKNDLLLFPLSLALLILFPTKNLFSGLTNFIPVISLFVFSQIYIAYKMISISFEPTFFKISDQRFRQLLIAVILFSVILRMLPLDNNFLNYHGARQYQTLLIAKSYFYGGLDLINPVTYYAPIDSRVFTINGLEMQFLPLFSQPFFIFFGLNNISAHLATLCLSVLSILLFYLLQKESQKDSLVPLLATALFCFTPLFFFLGTAYLPEAVSMVFLLVFAFSYAKIAKEKSPSVCYKALLLCSASLLGLSKPPLIIFLFPFFAFSLLSIRKKPGSTVVPAMILFSVLPACVYYLIQLSNSESNLGNTVVGDYLSFLNLLNPEYYIYLTFSLLLLVGSAFLIAFCFLGLKNNVNGLTAKNSNFLLLLGAVLYAIVFSGGTWNNTYYLVFWAAPIAGFAAEGIAMFSKRSEARVMIAIFVVITMFPVAIRFLLPSSSSSLTLGVASNISSLSDEEDFFIYGICADSPRNIDSEVVYLSGSKALYIGEEREYPEEIEDILRSTGSRVYFGPLLDNYSLPDTSLEAISYQESNSECSGNYLLLFNYSKD